MRFLLRIALLSLLISVAGMSTASAGGWASVEIGNLKGTTADEERAVVMSVLGHGITPIEVNRVVLVATNTETGESIVFDAEHTGETGQYAATIEFPEAGHWKLVAKIPPYPDFALPTLSVLDGSKDSDDPIERIGLGLIDGACDDPAANVREIGPAELGTSGELMGSTDRKLSDVLSSSTAVVALDPDGNRVGCSAIQGLPDSSQIVVALTPFEGDAGSGVVVLDATTGGTMISYFPVGLNDPAAVQIVDIVGDAGDWRYEPANVTIEPGSMVIWRNASAELHTVAGESIGFKDSPVVMPGESFTQVFDEPGSYSYFCGPHQWMTGVVTVKS